MTTPIYNQKITGPTAWTGSDFEGKEDIVFELGPRQVSAFEDILTRVKDVPRDEITREQATHPDLEGELAKVYREVMHGRGLSVVRGFPVGQHSLDEVEKIYWAFSLHFGNLLSQNGFGDRMVKVQQQRLPDGSNNARGTKSSAELSMHNDAGDVFMLLYVQQALSGGESQFSSGAAAHNAVLERRPDLLPILYRGFPHHRRGEEQLGQSAVTPYDVPVFANSNGRISIHFVPTSFAPALYATGRRLTAQEEEAFELMREVLFENQFEVRLEAGEVTVANNFGICHARTNYVDGPLPNQSRLVLRTWTEVPLADRLLPVGREFYKMENAGGRLGFDPVPGLEKKITRAEYFNNSEIAELIKTAQENPKGVRQNDAPAAARP